MKLYVASSWRNKYQQDVVHLLLRDAFNPFKDGG